MEVSRWMTTAPHCVSSDARLDAVADAMGQGRFRQVPVVDEAGRLVGIVTQGDLREHKGYLDTTKVSAAMTEPAIAVAPDDPIEAAAKILLERKIGGLPVVDRERRVVGILTTSDLLRGLLNSIGGSGGVVRLDLELADPEPGFAEVVRAIEAAGAIVLSLGTDAAAADQRRRFFVRVPAACAERAATALAAAGLTARCAAAPA
jgi:acetoin utilization protein AcuB